MGRNFYHPAVLFLFCLSFVFIGCGSGGNGGGGNGGGDTGPFETAAYFPLGSGWETDDWTLGVDAADYDINGTATKAMADTRDPGVLFWTNDENGLLLHGFLDEDGLMVVFEPPFLFAKSICRVGDKYAGTYAIDDEEISYTIELVGVENVSVPAGTFNNCLKFVLHLWPSSELPSAYGYETFWLAKNVGFVKGMADENSGSELFTDTGETRQLLSYHITPAEMTDDERAVREASELANGYFRTGDMESLADLISDDFFDRNCRDKAAVLDSYTNFMDNVSDYLEVISIEDVTIDGDDAYILREYFATYTMDGTRYWDWNRHSSHWKKEIDGEWRTYGAQLGFRPDWLDVRIRNDNGNLVNPFEADFLNCENNNLIDSPDIISSFTVTGPPGSGISDLDLMPYWLAYQIPTERYFWCQDQLQNAVPGFYTFRVENLSGDYYVTTDYLEVTPAMDLPVLVSPADGDQSVPPNNVTLDWEPVAAAEYYRVDLMFLNNDTWSYVAGFPVTLNISQYTVNLDPNTDYRWRVRARQDDLYNNIDNEARSGYQFFSTNATNEFTITGYLQYRTYSDGSNLTRGWLEFTKNNNPIDESDIIQIDLKNSTGNPVTISGTTFYPDSYFWGAWNDSTSSVDFSGLNYSHGFSISFPVATNFPAGNYTYEATTSEGVILPLVRNYPGDTVLPVVDVASMEYEWLIDGGLHLTWSVPASGTYDQLRVSLTDQDSNGLFWVRLPPDKEELTIPAEWIQQATNFRNPSYAIWQVQTRSNAPDGNNYARGYSGEACIPWGGACP
jgi:ketosteroid isomerase-like protein